MFQAKPATAGADAFDRLKLFMNVPPTPFDLKRLEQDAKQLENASPSEAHTVRAGICALKWDANGAAFWSEKACLANGGATTRSNASVTFRYLNDLSRAIQYAHQAVKTAPLDRGGVLHLAALLVSAGRVAEAVAVRNEYLHRVPDGPPLENGPERISGFFDELGIREDQVHEEIAAAMLVLSEDRVRYDDVEYESDYEPDGAGLLVVKVKFRGDLAAEMRLESRLAQKLADMPRWNPSKLSVEYEYVMEVSDAGQPA